MHLENRIYETILQDMHGNMHDTQRRRKTLRGERKPEGSRSKERQSERTEDQARKGKVRINVLPEANIESKEST